MTTPTFDARTSIRAGLATITFPRLENLVADLQVHMSVSGRETSKRVR